MCSDQNDTKTMKPRRAYNHYHQSFYVAISVFLRWFSFVSISINPWEISFLSSRVCYPSLFISLLGHNLFADVRQWKNIRLLFFLKHFSLIIFINLFSSFEKLPQESIICTFLSQI